MRARPGVAARPPQPPNEEDGKTLRRYWSLGSLTALFSAAAVLGQPEQHGARRDVRLQAGRLSNKRVTVASVRRRKSSATAPPGKREMVSVNRQSFQEAIDRAVDGMRGTDMVLCIVWKRVGSPLNPGLWHRADGTPFESGTLLEFETAVEAVRSAGGSGKDAARRSGSVSASSLLGSE
jgi:hypothetical protein